MRHNGCMTPHPSHPAAERQGSLLRDALAGCAMAGLLLPEAVAYSGIAGLPAQAGLVGLLIGLLVYGTVGTSRFALVSATSSSAAVMGAALLPMSGSNPVLLQALAAGMVLMCGIFFVLASVARLGQVTDFIAKPVLRGFGFGLGLTIVTRQALASLGLHPDHPDWLRMVLSLLWPGTAPTINLWGGALCLLAWLLLVALKRWHWLPGSLVVLVLSIALDHGYPWQRLGVEVVGGIDLGHWKPIWPALERTQWLRLGELAFALVLVLYAESYGAIRSLALKHKDNTQPNRDLAVLGAANLLCGLLSGTPVGAGFSASVANEVAGARSRWAGVTAAAVVVLIVSLFLPELARTPQPVLAAIVIHALGHTLEPALFRPYWHWRRDRLLVVATLIGVLVLGVLDGLLAAIGISVLLSLRDQSTPTISRLGRLNGGHDFVALQSHPEARELDHLLILRPEAPLFFVNAERVQADIQRLVENSPQPLQAVMLSLDESADVDGTTIEALQALAQGLEDRGVSLLLARLKPQALEGLRRATTPALPLEALMEWSVDQCVLQWQRRTAGAAVTRVPASAPAAPAP